MDRVVSTWLLKSFSTSLLIQNSEYTWGLVFSSFLIKLCLPFSEVAFDGFLGLLILAHNIWQLNFHLGDPQPNNLVLDHIVMTWHVFFLNQTLSTSLCNTLWLFLRPIDSWSYHLETFLFLRPIDFLGDIQASQQNN